MPRPPIERAVGGVPRTTLFKPAGVPARELEQLQLTVDELEAIHLVDLDGLSHEQAAEALDVSRQTVGRVLQLLEGLPRKQQEVVRLKFQHGLSYREIAVVTGHSQGNVGFLIHTAIKTLRQLLAEQPVRARSAR